MYTKVRKLSQGKSRKDARDNADLIDHGYELNEEELRINGFFLAEMSNRFSEQRVYTWIYIYLKDKSSIWIIRPESFLYDVDNVQSIYDNDMVKHYFKMTAEGLSCLDCSEEDDQYRA